MIFERVKQDWFEWFWCHWKDSSKDSHFIKGYYQTSYRPYRHLHIKQITPTKILNTSTTQDDTLLQTLWKLANNCQHLTTQSMVLILVLQRTSTRHNKSHNGMIKPKLLYKSSTTKSFTPLMDTQPLLITILSQSKHCLLFIHHMDLIFPSSWNKFQLSYQTIPSTSNPKNTLGPIFSHTKSIQNKGHRASTLILMSHSSKKGPITMHQS